MSYLARHAVVRNGEVVIDFNVGHAPDQYYVYADDVYVKSAFMRILLTRGNWHRTLSITEANLILVANNPHRQLYRERCGGLGTIISHLPGESHFVDYFNLFSLARARYGFAVFKKFRLGYSLPRDMLKLRLHMERIDQLVAGVDVLARNAQNEQFQSKAQSQQKQAPKDKKNIGFSQGT